MPSTAPNHPPGSDSQAPHLVSTFSQAWALIQPLFPFQTRTNSLLPRCPTGRPVVCSLVLATSLRVSLLSIHNRPRAPPGELRHWRAVCPLLGCAPFCPRRRKTLEGVPWATQPLPSPRAGSRAGRAGRGTYREACGAVGGGRVPHVCIRACPRARVCPRTCRAARAERAALTSFVRLSVCRAVGRSAGADGLSPCCGRRPRGGPGSRQSPRRAAAQTRDSRTTSARRGRGGGARRDARAWPGARGCDQVRAGVSVRAPPGPGAGSGSGRS
jgi:hypothetical protein